MGRGAILLVFIMLLSAGGQLVFAPSLDADVFPDYTVPTEVQRGVFNVTGDWNVSTPETFENSTIYMHGNITITDTGALTLRNSTLFFNLSANGEYWMEVDGTLVLQDMDSEPGTTVDLSLICSNWTGLGYTVQANKDSVLRFRNGMIADCGYNDANKGLLVDTADAIFEGMNFTRCHDGLLLKRSGAVVRNCTFYDNNVGVEFYLAEAEFENNTVMSSSSSGLYIYYCSPTVTHCLIADSTTGLNFRNSNSVVERCRVMDSSSSGVYAYCSSPLVLNSTLDNPLDLDVRTNSFPKMLNTDFNHSRATVGHGLYVSVGHWVEVEVTNESGSPMAGVQVVVLDQEGNPASSGVTNGSGVGRWMCFRSHMLTEDGPVNMSVHEVMAFDSDAGSVWYGQNVTALSPNGACKVVVHKDPPGYDIWGSSVISGVENRSDTRILALGDIEVSTTGSLVLNNSELLFLSQDSQPLELICLIGDLQVDNCTISSVGCLSPLDPGLVFIQVRGGSTGHIQSTTLRWVTEFEHLSTPFVTRNVDIEHASTGGLEVRSSAPFLENVNVDWAPRALTLQNDDATLANITMSYIRDYGTYSYNSNSRVTNMTVADVPRGLYSYSTELQLDNSLFYDCNYGMYCSYSRISLAGTEITGSTSHGAYLVSSELYLDDSNITSCGTGLDIQDTAVRAESSSLTGNGLGIRVSASSPLLLNSTLDNPTNLNIHRASAARLVNCTFDQARVTLQPSSYMDVGDWVDVSVLDQAMEPVDNCSVVIMDSNGETASSSLTDVNGLASVMAFRSLRRYWNRTEDHAVHSILAYVDDNGTSYTSLNITALLPGDHPIVEINAAGTDWIYWPSDHYVGDGNDSYNGKTILAGGGLAVNATSGLHLADVVLWLAGNSSKKVEVYGNLSLLNVTLAPLGTSAPLEPTHHTIVYHGGSSGAIEDTNISNLAELVTYTDDLSITDSRLSLASVNGIRVEGSAPVLTRTSIQICANGLGSSFGSPMLSNCTIVECGSTGLSAKGGEPRLEGTLITHNKDGVRLEEGADGTFKGCTLRENAVGLFASHSSPLVNDTRIEDNLEKGAGLQYSYAVIRDSELVGNGYGLYCTYSGPEIYDTNFSGNSYGAYVYTSGPYFMDCGFDGNYIGIYNNGDASNIELGTFSSGRSRELATFVDGGWESRYGITLPKRAILDSANLTVEGVELANEAVIEDPYSQLYPSIWGDRVVWQDKRDGNWEIYSYNLSMDSDGDGIPNYMETPQLENDPALRRITDDPAVQSEPALWEDTIVWTDLRNGNYDIYAYTFSNDTEWAVIEHPSVQWKPSLYGDHVIWSDLRSGNNDIYMLNVTEHEYSRLSTSTRHDLCAEIHGDTVVWYSYTGSAGGSEYSDIHQINITSWEFKDLTNDDPLQYKPDIDGNSIVWHDDRNGNWEIYRMSLPDGRMERITNEVEHSFCPKVHENLIVYYYHDRTADTWSVRMYDTSTGNQSVLEGETEGDSCPVVHGKRIAWTNKTDNKNDIYVLDLGLRGHVSNATLDIGNDGTLEFFEPGTFNTLKFINETLLMALLREHTSEVTGGFVEVLLNVTADDTGRIGLGPLAIHYDLPTYIINCTISNCSSTGVYSSSSRPIVINSSLDGNVADVKVLGTGDVHLLNTSFNEAAISFGGPLSNLTVQNFLHVRAQNLSIHPLNAGLVVEDNNQTVFCDFLGEDGEAMWLIVTDAKYNRIGRHENITLVTVSFGSQWFEDNPRSVDMGTSHWEVFNTDTVDPLPCNEFPLAYSMHPDTEPTISVWVTDNNCIDISTVRLYVQGYSVFYSTSPVPGGYNVSYHHPVGFPDGQVVHCQVLAEDTHNNMMKYDWEFLIDTSARSLAVQLQEGWNLVSVPFETYSDSIEAVLRSVSGKYDVVRTYNRELGGVWLENSLHKPQEMNTLTSLDSSAGIWLHVTEACTLYLSGILHDSTAIDLYTGWNLVAYPTLNANTSLGSALWGTGADMVEGFDPMSPYQLVELQSTYIMKPGEAYWVRVPADTVWVVDW